jgi:hypothetical protein
MHYWLIQSYKFVNQLADLIIIIIIIIIVIIGHFVVNYTIRFLLLYISQHNFYTEQRHQPCVHFPTWMTRSLYLCHQ